MSCRIIDMSPIVFHLTRQKVINSRRNGGGRGLPIDLPYHAECCLPVNQSVLAKLITRLYLFRREVFVVIMSELNFEGIFGSLILEETTIFSKQFKKH